MNQSWAAVAASAVTGVILSAGAASAAPADQQIYIVQMKGAPAARYEGTEAGLAATRPTKGKIDASSEAVQSYLAHLSNQHRALADSAGLSPVYEYGLTLNGFAAPMTPEQAAELAEREDVAAVYPNRTYALETTRSYAFMGLNSPSGPWLNGHTGEDVVIGIVDGGIWPEHPCFEDRPTPQYGAEGPLVPYGPAPSGFSSSACEIGNTSFNSQDVPFTCNNKLLAARYFVAGFGASGISPGSCLSARDCGSFGDHGTNVAGNAACNAETTAYPGGVDVGEIYGMAPRARLSHYKVCWSTPTATNGTCSNVDIVAAIEQAITDGVDVMNLSLGGDSPLLGDAMDVALLNASTAGIFVATSAGNSGPGAGTVGSPATAPWVTSVGAMQDDSVTATGLEVTSPSTLAGVRIGIEGSGPVTLAASPDIVAEVVVAAPLVACTTLTNPAAMAGKIALVSRGTCAFNDKYLAAQAAGAVGIVVYNDGTSADRMDPIAMSVTSTAVTIPGIMIGYSDGAALRTAIEGGTTVIGRLSSAISEPRGDRIADFSSRGPNGFTADLLKPDIVAPGVRILSAGSPLGGLDNDGLWSTLQGTSFSSPHVAGLLALIHQEHPAWSPAIAKSAFMTTARQDIKETFGETLATPFDIGAGMVNPELALNPGLAYDAREDDYRAYACGQNIIFSTSVCQALSAAGYSFDPVDLNYPSVTVSTLVGSRTTVRTVTNVSDYRGTWDIAIDAPPGFAVTVSPQTVTLASGASASFTISVVADGSIPGGQWSFGEMMWIPRRARNGSPVRSPISLRSQRFSAPTSVTGTGTSGSTSFPVAFGYTGAYTAAVHGLDPATRTAATVVDDPANDINTALSSGVGITVVPVTVPAFGTAGPAFARFALADVDTDGNDDLDLYVFNPSGAFVGSSATPSSNETVNVTNPVAGTWLVVVHGYDTDGPDANFTLSSWSFGVNDDRGNSSITAPTSATLGGVDTVGYSWTGLTAGTEYWGAVSHSDASGVMTTTLVQINAN